MEIAYTHAKASRENRRVVDTSGVERRDRIPYSATDTALVECVLGNPYSRAADPDMVILWRGGDNGRGRLKAINNFLLTKPLVDDEKFTIIDLSKNH